jgi:hypothetical protein
MTSIGDKFAVQLLADKTSENDHVIHIDHMLVASQSGAIEIPKIMTDWRGVEHCVGVKKQVRSSDGSASAHSIYCEIESNKTIAANWDTKEY